MKFSSIALFVILYFSGTVVSWANQSILKQLKAHKTNDTLRVNLLNQAGWEIVQNHPDSAITYFTEALTISEKIDFEIGTAKALVNLGVANFYLGNYPLALNYYLKALKIWESKKNLKNMATLYGNIGIIHGLQEEYKEAENYYLKALRIAEKFNDRASMAKHYGNLGMTLSYQGKNSEALAYHYKALKIDEELGDSSYIAADYGNLGSVYLSLNDLDRALQFFNKALIISMKLADVTQEAVWYANIGNVYFKKNNLKQALYYFNKALALDKEINSLEGLIEDHKNLYVLYDKIGDAEKALHHYKNYITLRDSVYNEENTKSLVKAEMNFEFEKKEAINRAKQEQQRLIIYGIIVITIIVIVFAFFIYNRFKVSQKQKAIIEKQKIEVEKQREIALEQKKISEERQKEILDSIHYAWRIQQAMLTSEEYISQYLKDNYFILYMPKDIVAGDFYWALKHNNLFYICTADCTGHGVPGAFMSLLNISFLNENVLERNLIMPHQILNEQRKQIIKALNPKGNENSKDGMDCVLAAFDFENMKLHFAQANNPLVILRTNAPLLRGIGDVLEENPITKHPAFEIIEYKAQKMPVGRGLREHEPFELQTVELKKGDIVYTWSDGYPDQFGTNGKKFMSKNLKNLLLEIAHLPLAEQKQILCDRIEAHKNGTDQTDDILVIGVKI